MLDLKNKKILVAGGSGFMGSHVVAALKSRGVSDEKIVAPNSAECDLRVFADCQKAVKGIDVVFDCAAVPGDILMREKIPGQLFYENLLMGIQLLEAARQEGVGKAVVIGSATEYPADAPTPLNEESLWNGLPSSGNIPYGMSKRIVGIQGAMYRRESGFNAIHLLLTNSYGPGEKFESGYMVPSLIQKIMNAKARGEQEIEVWGTGQALRDLMYVEDAAEGIVRAAERYDDAAPLNIGSGAGISVKDLVMLLSKLIGFEGTIRWDTTKPEGDLKRLLDVSRAERTIGFKTKTPLEEGLKKTIEWHREQSSVTQV
ncbi:MAG: NAD-dependent epimerase/dehydratase family protein [Candidatus Liptonbacteria bacterium]|nr:NAD-dependent epimerase/dehydratase family protein [Candidatus Liptonbacteria bacterium]